MKSVASKFNFLYLAFICIVMSIIFSLYPIIATAQDFTYPEGTLEELLQQVDLFASNPENARQGYLIRIFLVPGSYHTGMVLLSPGYLENTASFSITNVGSDTFCISLNVSSFEAALHETCLYYEAIASISFVDDFLQVRSGGLFPLDGIPDFSIANMVRYFRLTGSENFERAGSYLQFFHSLISGSNNQSSAISGILIQINIVYLNRSTGISGIYRYQHEYFCIGMLRGFEGASREYNYCIPYTNLAAVRDVYSNETSGGGFYTRMDDFLAREYGDIDPATLPLPASELSAEEIQSILTNWQQSTPNTDLLVSLRIPTHGSLTVRMSHEFREGLRGELRVLTELTTDYFCFVPWTVYSDAITPETFRPAEDRTCILFGNIAGIEEAAIQQQSR